MKYLFVFASLILSNLLFANDFENAKAVIDQGNFYTIKTQDRNVILEIRSLDKYTTDVSYKLIPIRKMEDGRDIVWDIKDGYLYAINLMEQANMEIGETLKRFKIVDLKDDLNFKFTVADYIGNSYLSNKPFIDLYNDHVNLDKLVFDISVSDKVYIYISNNEQFNYVYSTGIDGNWENIKMPINDSKNFISYNHLFYNENIIYTNLDCETCTQQKALRNIKEQPLMLINKDDKSVFGLSTEMLNTNNEKLETKNYIQKNSKSYEFSN